MKLDIGRAYSLSKLYKLVWNTKHEVFEQPAAIAGIYLGCLSGKRTWHLFEVIHHDKEEGVIMMNDDDLNKIIVEEL